jgi:hypothetical protein
MFVIEERGAKKIKQGLKWTALLAAASFSDISRSFRCDRVTFSRQMI